MSANTTTRAPLLTIPEVARRLGLHRDTVYRKIERGEIPAIRIGPDNVGPLRVREDDLDENEGADGDVVLELDIPEPLFVEYEWVEEGKTYREAMIPAAKLNAHRGTVRVLSQDESDELTGRRWDSFSPVEVANPVAEADSVASPDDATTP